MNEENKQEKQIKIGIIGGSGLDNPDILKDSYEKDINTPYGKPSSKILTGKINGIDVHIISRHGKNHEIPPSQVNYRANIFALGQLGCTHILSTTAVGSLKEEIKRGDFVILSDFIDFTRHRKTSFFEKFPDEPEHASMIEPFSPVLRKRIISACKELNISHHDKGVVITIEGPRFSTKAESNLFRQWGADVINMSIAPEAVLAREGNLNYAAIAMSTDYDVWKENDEVSWKKVLEIFNKNSDKMKKLLVKVIEDFNKPVDIEKPDEIKIKQKEKKVEKQKNDGNETDNQQKTEKLKKPEQNKELKIETRKPDERKSKSNKNKLKQGGTIKHEEQILTKIEDDNKVVYKTKCINCQKEAVIPYVPRRGKPVYCKECYVKIKNQKQDNLKKSKGNIEDG